MTTNAPLIDSRILDGHGNRVTSESGALAVVIQDQHSEIFGRSFMRAVGGPYTFAIAPTIGSYVIILSAGHTFSGGDELLIVNNRRSMSASVVSVSVNTLILDTPVSVDNGIIFKVLSNMNENGSVTPVIFKVSLPSTAEVELDVKGIRFHITDNSAMDDSLFGGIGALTRGVVARIMRADGSQFLLWNVKTNQEILLRCNNSYYSDKAPSGFYGFFSDWRMSDLGITIRVSPGDTLEIIIQDDLTALATFRSFVYGHIVVD